MSSQALAETYRVKQFAVPPASPDGLTWATAFPTLEAALAVADENDSIFVAASGATPYHPQSAPPGVTDPRRKRIEVIATDVAILGGFPAAGSDSGRDVVANETIFSGDLFDDDASAENPNLPTDPAFDDNAAHIFHFTEGNGTVLDGVIIRDARNFLLSSAGDWGFYGRGGGVLITDVDTGKFATPIFQNCRFERNLAAKSGGAILATAEAIIEEGGGEDPASYPSTIQIRNCEFRLNTVFLGSPEAGGGGDDGGAIHLSRGALLVADSVIADNIANQFGGAIFAYFPTSLQIVHSTVTNNAAEDGSAGVAVEFSPYQLDGTGKVPAGVVDVQSSIVTGNFSKSGSGDVSNQLGNVGSVIGRFSVNYTIMHLVHLSGVIDPGVGNQSTPLDTPDFFVDRDSGVDHTLSALGRDYHIVPSYRRCVGPIDLGTPNVAQLPLDGFDADDDGDEAELLPDLDRSERFKVGYESFPGCVDIGAYETSTSDEPYHACWSDFTADGDVEAADLAILLGDWGTSGCRCADLDGDGVVGAMDLAVLLGDWGPCVLVIDPPLSAQMSGEPAAEAALSSEPQPVMSPDQLAVLYGFGTLEDFAMWLATLAADDRAAVLASLSGGGS